MKLVELLNVIDEYNEIVVADDETGDLFVTGKAGQLPYRIVKMYENKTVTRINSSFDTLYIYIKK